MGKDEYVKEYIMGSVPCIKDKNFVLGESNSIMRYLANSRNIDNNLFPKDQKKRALIDNYLDWHLGNTRVASSSLIEGKLLAPMFG